MNFCSLQDAYGIKTFKSPKVVKLGQKGKGLRGLYDTPGAPPKSDTIGAPAGGCEDQEDVLITKARQTTPIVVEDGPAAPYKRKTYESLNNSHCSTLI